MGIEMYLGSSDHQSQSVRTVLNNRVNAYQSLQTSLHQFIYNSPSLKGQTYSSAKSYSQQVLIPLIKGCILLDEAVTEACGKLPSEYRGQVDNTDLKEDELVDKICRVDMTIGRYVYLIELEYSKDKPNYVHLSNLRSSKDFYQDVKRQLEEKLQKLRSFNGSSVQLFSHIDSLISNVQTGMRQAQTSWNPQTKTFVLPPAKDMKWAKTVNGQWEKRISKNEKSLYEQFKDIMESDTAKRLSQLMSLLPDKFTESVLKSDGFWAILSSVEKSGAKGQKAVDLILKGLVKYESLGKSSKWLSGFSEFLEKGVSLGKELTKFGLGKLSNIKALEEAVYKGKNFVGNAKFLGKAIKTIGKVGTVLTFATVAFEGVSGGIDEYGKTGDVGKAVGKGLSDAVSSVGPLEGATIGATVASVVPIPGASQAVGAGIGFVVGLGIQGIKMLEPKFFDDPIKGTKNIINKTGKALSGAAEGVSNFIGGIGKAIGFG